MSTANSVHHHRGQQVDPLLTEVALGGIRVLAGDIGVGGQHIAKGAHCLDLRLHRQQHAPDVRVMDDRHPVAAALPCGPPLDPFLGKVARRLIGALGDPNALQPDLLPGLVHHREHVRQTLVLPTRKIADRTVFLAKAHDASWARVDAELVLDRGALDIVAPRHRAVRADQEFRDHKQRDAAGPFRRIRKPGKHQVHNILGHVVVAPGVKIFWPEIR
jgi:hypothetical protein